MLKRAENIHKGKMGAHPLKPVKWYKSLSTKKGRITEDAFIIEGKIAVDHILTHHPERVLEIVISENFHWQQDIQPCRILNESQFRKISLTKSTQGIMAILHLPKEIYSDQLPDKLGNKVLLLEHIQDPGNIGTLMRTAAAFEFSGILFTEKCADPLSHKCVRSSAGSMFSLWMRRTSRYLKLIETLKQKGYGIIAADLNGEGDTSPLLNQEKMILALGNEASGLSEQILKLSDFRMCIPISREKSESLNVAICGGICMYLSSMKEFDKSCQS